MFKNDSKNVEVDEIVEFLLENEFIESDRYDDIFFLTRETYEFIEMSYLEVVLSSFIETDEVLEPEKDFDFDTINNDGELESKDRLKQNKINRSVFLFSIMLMIVWASFELFQNKDVRTSIINIDQKELNGLSEQMKNKVDSLKATHNIIKAQ